MYLADGYGEVVAQIAALGVIEDLPADMRGFVDTVLEEHTAHQQRDNKIRGLAESLGSHWRQWPELCWKASSLGVAPETLDEHRQWRGEGDRLIAQASNLLANQGEDGHHLAAMEGVRSGLESSLARIEKVRTFDDLARFERDWTGIILDASKTGVPEIHVPGYRDIAEIGKRLAGAEGLDDGQRRMIANWQKADRLQGGLSARIESLPNEAARWLSVLGPVPRRLPGTPIMYRMLHGKTNARPWPTNAGRCWTRTATMRPIWMPLRERGTGSVKPEAFLKQPCWKWTLRRSMALPGP